MPLTPPIEDKSSAAFRALVESTAGLFPLGGFITRIFQTTHPAKFARDVAQWQGDVTATVNDLATRVASLEAEFSPRLALSAPALEVALWLLAEDAQGALRSVSLTQVVTAFPALTPGRVEEAVHELADLDLVTVRFVAGGGGDRIRLNWPLMWLFEPLASGVSPLNDAAELARDALTTESLEAYAIQAARGWAPRRINAALELLATFASPGDARRVANPAFTVFALHIDAGTRGRLRRFLGSGAEPHA